MAVSENSGLVVVCGMHKYYYQLQRLGLISIILSGGCQ